MEQNETRNTISISEVWNIFVSHIWQIVLIGILIFAVFTGYSVLTYKAEYTSTASVYLLRQNGDEPGEMNVPSAQDFSLALNTVNDCRITLESKRVLDQVIKDLGMDISDKQLRSMIKVNNPEKTRYLNISVTAPTASDAKIIVDKLCEVGSEEVMKIMGMKQVTIVDEGSYSERPTNSKVTPMCFLAGIGAAVIVYVVYLLIYIFDDKIIDADNVEKVLGLTVLGTIPNAADIKEKRYGKYGKYGSKYGSKYAPSVDNKSGRSND